MADNGLDDRRLIGLCFDGTGYGTDGALWGGEVLLASYSDFERFAHLEYLPLPGGESASRTPWRTAVAYAQALGLEIDDLPFLQQVDRRELETLGQQLEGGKPSLTSCMENLMEAVAGLIGIRNETTYESQATIEMEVLARPFVSSVSGYPFVIETTQQGTVIRLKELLAALVQDVRSGRSVEMIAARFHKTVVDLALDVCRRARRSANLNEVVLSGGVWQNQILMDLVRKELKHDGFTVYTHCQVPANDSGLALGQAVVANYSSSTGELLSPQGYAPVTRDDHPSGEKVS
jgi:hydrogenase maturation protein HypF